MQGVYVLQLSATDGLLSGSDTVTVTVNADPANKAIDFGGTNAFVTLGPAPGLGASRFTIETWFRRDGAGVATFTGTGGVIAIPLVTKGMAEVDDVNNRDMNYFLGIRQSDGVLVADFEDTATGGQPRRGRHDARLSRGRSGTTPRRPTTARRGASTSTGSSTASWSSGRSRRASTAFSTRRSARR